MNNRMSGVVVAAAIIAFVYPLTRGEDKPMSPVDSLLLQASGMSRRTGEVIVPCDFELHLRPYPSQAGPVDIHVTLTPRFNCENGVELTVDTLDNLTNLGGAHYAIPGVAGEISNIDLQVSIPGLDTSSLTLRLSGVGKAWEYKIPMSFVSESDTIKFYYGSDRFSLRPPVIERPRRVMSVRDSIAHLGAEFQPPPTVRFGYYDEQGRFVPSDSVVDGVTLDGRRVGHYDDDGNFIAVDSVLKENEFRRRSKVLIDSVRGLPGGEREWGIRSGNDGYPYIFSRKRAEDSSDAYFEALQDSAMVAQETEKLQEIRELEKSPLVGADHQVISVGGVIYMRRRGETKFHTVETTTDMFAHSQALHDSLQMSKGRIFDFTFDLRNSEHLAFARAIVDSLVPTDSAGFFRAVIDWVTYKQLRDHEVPMRKTGYKPRGSRQQDGDVGGAGKDRY